MTIKCSTEKLQSKIREGWIHIWYSWCHMLVLFKGYHLKGMIMKGTKSTSSKIRVI